MPSGLTVGFPGAVDALLAYLPLVTLRRPYYKLSLPTSAAGPGLAGQLVVTIAVNVARLEVLSLHLTLAVAA